MSADVIISYDGTPNDDDALALGKILASAGVTLALAYVRHSREFDPQSYYDGFRKQGVDHEKALADTLYWADCYERADLKDWTPAEVPLNG